MTFNQKDELERYPKYKEQYIRCFNVMVENRNKKGFESMKAWKTGQDVYDWWVKSGTVNYDHLSMMDMEEEE